MTDDTTYDEILPTVEAMAEGIESFTARFEKSAAEMKGRIDGLEVALKRTGPGGAVGPDEIKAALTFEAIVRGAPVSPDDAKLDVEQFAAYRKAFSNYVRKPAERLLEEDRRALQVGEAKALSVGVDADGGYWTTPELSDRIVKRTFETSPMRQIANVVSITTDAIEFPTDTNDATSGGWVGEKDARAETATPQIGKIRIPVHEQFANPRATQKLLDDGGFDVEGWLADKIADKLARDENLAFVNGIGVDQPRGFLDYAAAATTDADADRDWGVLQYVFTGASGGFDTTGVGATEAPADELIDLQAALKPRYRANAVWLMSRATEAEVRKLHDTAGNYLVTQNTGNITGVPIGGFVLLGSPIVQAEDMPAIAADSFSIAYGDFSAGYQIVDRQGVRVLRDPFSSKPFVQFYTTKRVGGDLIDSDAIKLLKFGTS